MSAKTQRESTDIRFWKYTMPTEGCWHWIGDLQKNGYGRLGVGRKHHLAHRISYRLFNGEIPDGLEIDHLCRNRSCVNPDHLETVTRRVNQARGETLAANNNAKTHCPRGHEYAGYNLRVRRGKRECRECGKIDQRAIRERRKLATA